ncbi:CheR family methyltransferase [Cupriavidus agavae]|uniref:histidine kinase n=1 Tax=Cupriavidus agavae TaxID=1001822 RepID=A0A4V2FI44_9BURK|nr:CheR family methyltransferase [Cupriavidus agavae]RZT42489.1 two-component system CheB/CheR fusion protein [Cupriavidus agavae]
MVSTQVKSIPSQLNFPVVGIGASAGGVEALKTFFETLPARTGAAYVIVVHLSPDHESLLPEILGGVTSMPVIQVTDAVPVEANHVYLIAPSKVLTMVDSILRVQPLASRDDRRAAIDLFFRSLAEAHRERAVAIVLSGAASDGAVGITRIKELGGIVMAQHPEDAGVSSMPRAAIGTGQVDFVMPVSEMPQKLMEMWSNVQRMRGATEALHETDEELATVNERVLREIMVILRTRTSHDFRQYKRATVLRRIERRMQVNGLAELAEYRDFLHEHPEETPQLLQDMLISVTNFFRDREAFDALQSEVIPQLLDQRPASEPIRIWSAGCATGEEAYSVAMLLQDASSRSAEGVPFQVFATDIDERAITYARTGLYPESILADVEPGRARHFLVKDAAHYRVKKELREHVLFALHNLLRDPPFSRLDMICCRNLLIYLDRDAQHDVLRTFHFALRPGGFLFLGSSEAADSVGGLFTVVDKKARIYRANVAVRSDAPVPMTATMQSARLPLTVMTQPGRRKFSFGDLHQRVVEQYAPPSVLVSRESDIVHLSDRAGRFLQYAGGEPSHNIIAAVRPELRLELRTAIFQALQANHSVEARRVQLTREGRRFFVNMIARPVHDAEANADFVLILFDEVEDSMSADADVQQKPMPDPVVRQLERELQRTKEQLQATIEQSETSTEELKASNEELQAMNEELRSATEELETSKEELQSINEELTTVNAELKSKVEETSKINDDLHNLITANDIGTIFVDRTMRIKRYTPRATDVFSIIPSDIGRSLLDITHRLDYDKLADDATDAFDSLRLIEREVRSADGHWYLARFLPYRTTEDRIDGAVLSFIDITSRMSAEERLREGERRMRIVAESTRDYAIITFDDDGHVTSWNHGAERIFGYEEKEMLGQPAEMLFTPEDRARKVPAEEMTRARKFGRVEEDRWHLRKDGSRFRSSGVLSRLDEGGVSGFAKIARDLDEVLTPGAPRYESGWRHGHDNAQRDEFLAVASHELKHPLNLISASSELISRSAEARQNPLIARATDTIRRTVLSQAQIIDDLLDMSRVRTGKLSITRQPVDLVEVVRQVSDAVRDEARAQRTTLTVNLPQAPLWIHADVTRIEQVAWNLLSNALKFTAEGGEVTVLLETHGDMARFTVRDTGQGIAEQALPFIFDLFRQDGAPTGRPRGLGIGLSLVRELVTLHGGTVHAASPGRGEGATFTVELPVGSAARDGKPSAVVSATLLDGMRIMLVDDDAQTVEAFRVLLESEGATVDVAFDGRSALAQMMTQRPDLLLSDIGMADMDGYELLRRLRAQPELQSVLAIALSGYGRESDVRAARNAGFDAHLPKPVIVDNLLSTLLRLRQSPGR